MLRAVRVSLVVQAVCLIVLLTTLLPGFLDFLNRPTVYCPPDESCYDPTGAGFIIYALIFVPVGVVLVVTAWLWQTEKRWPALVPIALDLLLLGGGISDLDSPRQPVANNPPPDAELLLLVVPALLSLALIVTFVGLLTWRRVSARNADSAGAEGTPT